MIRAKYYESDLRTIVVCRTFIPLWLSKSFTYFTGTTKTILTIDSILVSINRIWILKMTSYDRDVVDLNSARVTKSRDLEKLNCSHLIVVCVTSKHVAGWKVSQLCHSTRNDLWLDSNVCIRVKICVVWSRGILSKNDCQVFQFSGCVSPSNRRRKFVLVIINSYMSREERMNNQGSVFFWICQRYVTNDLW